MLVQILSYNFPRLQYARRQRQLSNPNYLPTNMNLLVSERNILYVALLAINQRRVTVYTLYVVKLKDFLEQRKQDVWKRLAPFPSDIVVPYKDIKPLPKTRDTSLMDELISKVVVLKVELLHVHFAILSIPSLASSNPPSIFANVS